MKTNTPATKPPHTVETVLSQSAVRTLECLVRWYWNDFDGSDIGLIDKLMTLLRVYVEHCPENAHKYRQPAAMTDFVSELLQLKSMLDDVENDVRPHEWIDTIGGWRLPMPERQGDAVE